VSYSVTRVSRSRWPRGLRRESAGIGGFESRRAERISVSCECCVFSGRGLSYGLITRPEESYRMWSWTLDNEEAMAH